MQRMEHDLAGHTIDPDTFLHDGTLRFGHHVASQQIVLIS